MTQTMKYHSLIEFKETHRQLLTQRRDVAVSTSSTPTEPVEVYLDAVEQFIHQGVTTGAILDKDEERRDAQNLLDYWSNELYHQGREAPDATLAEYDLTATPQLPDNLCPYVGLDTFSAQNRGIFFGRTRLIELMESSCKTAVSSLLVALLAVVNPPPCWPASSPNCKTAP